MAQIPRGSDRFLHGLGAVAQVALHEAPPLFLCIKNNEKAKAKNFLLEVQVLCPEKFKNSCERGSPCISMFGFFRIKIEYNSLLKNIKR